MSSRVLIVEDDAELCQLVAEAFKIEGFETLTATSIEKALDVLSRHKIDLIFADIVISDKKSTDYIKHVLDKNKDLNIIFTSAHYELVKKENLAPEERVTAVSKPYDIEEVIKKAKKILDSRQ